MLHGDAAFAGQGVVAETLNLANLPGYRVGGTIHIIVNNQIGFTTAPEFSRSSEYCTDVAKMIGAPIFHVNGDDPEACVWVAKLAVDFRQKFQKDVIIDMLCYRRRGHNEGDDPSMTNPYMYDVVDTKRGVRKSYTEALIGRGDISMKEAEDALRDYQGQLERVFNEVRELEKHGAQPSESVEADQMIPAGLATAVDKSLLARIGDAFLAVAGGLHRAPAGAAGAGEAPGDGLRGQDRLGVRRAAGAGHAGGRRQAGPAVRTGHPPRHLLPAAFGDHRPQHRRGVHPAAAAGDRQGRQPRPAASSWSTTRRCRSTPPSASSTATPWATRTQWCCGRAQFGDFVNGAQSIIDEFISSGEAKWGQLSNVVLLLPHGHEGQGPDHTSGRIERFLQLWAEGSMTIAVPSTPANYFHLLRRHALDGVQRPLIVFTPKSMLRNKAAVSDIRDFTETKFRSVLEEPTYEDGIGDRSKVTRILLTSGKIYYELAARKAKDNRDDVAIVRIEQLAPLPKRRLARHAGPLPERHGVLLGPGGAGQPGRVAAVRPGAAGAVAGQADRDQAHSRRAMSAPSSGSSKVHAVEQQEIIDAAFG